ncbi:MAG: iron-containing alcohol dehydrogenase [Actinomycetota bacterium]
MDISRLNLFPIKSIHPTPAALLGPGAHEMIGVSAAELGMKKVLLMTTGLRGTGIVDEVKGVVEAAGVSVEVFDRVESNPKDHNVMDAHVAYVDAGCDGFISLGGGSSHDCTKATRVVAAHDGRTINDFKGELTLDNPVLPPHIAVSTTAGTGSETSFAFVVTDTTTGPENHKFASFAHQISPSMCIDDPVLFMPMPSDLTAYCGFDVLAHAAGAYVSILDAIPSWGPALQAIELTFKHLPTVVGNGYDPVAREQMMHAQYIAGLAFNSAGLDITHSISHAMSAKFDTHHGMGNGIAITRVWEHNVSANYPKFARMAEAMGYNTRGLTDVAAADLAIEGIHRLAADVGIPPSFGNLPDYTKSRVGMNGFPPVSATPGDIEHLTMHALGDVCTVTNPRIMTPESMSALVTDSLVGAPS